MVEALLVEAAWLTPTSLFLLLNVVIATILISSAFNHHQNHSHHSGDEPSSAASPPHLARTSFLFSRVPSFNFSNYHHNHNPSPSLFTRVTSFNFSGRATEPDPTHDPNSYADAPYSSPSLFSRFASFNFSGRANHPDPTQDPIPDARDVGHGHVMMAEARAPYFLSRIASFSRWRRDPHTEVCQVDSHLNNNDNNNNNCTTSGSLARPDKSTRTVARAPYGRDPQSVEVSEINAHRTNDDSNNGGTKVGQKEKEKAVKKEKNKNKMKKETAAFRRRDNNEEVDAKADDFINRFKQQLKLQRMESMLRCRSA